jgi:hypothetical protein
MEIIAGARDAPADFEPRVTSFTPRKGSSMAIRLSCSVLAGFSSTMAIHQMLIATQRPSVSEPEAKWYP